MTSTINESAQSKVRVGSLRRLTGLLLVAGAAAGFSLTLILNTESEPSWPEVNALPGVADRFNLQSATVDIQEIQAGGPPKDGIPALSHPEFVPAQDVDYLQPSDRIIGVVLGDEPRAYPLAILNHHEIVNDTMGQTPLAVTYCPLCDSAAVYDRRTPLGEREFGVSGLLFNSNVLMYDRRGTPESLWSQVRTTGISGPGAGQRLTALPCELTTWESWTARFPHSLVLSTDTGHQRDYSRNPYEEYFRTQELRFPASPSSPILANKERILGVWAGEQYRAYPEAAFPSGVNQITDSLSGKSLTIALDRASRTLRVARADEGVSWLYSFWFAWYALHPHTTVYGQ